MCLIQANQLTNETIYHRKRRKFEELILYPTLFYPRDSEGILLHTVVMDDNNVSLDGTEESGLVLTFTWKVQMIVYILKKK